MSLKLDKLVLFASCNGSVKKSCQNVKFGLFKEKMRDKSCLN